MRSLRQRVRVREFNLATTMIKNVITNSHKDYRHECGSYQPNMNDQSPIQDFKT